MTQVYVMYLGRSKLIFTKGHLLEEIETYLDVPGIDFRLKQVEMSQDEYDKLPKVDLRDEASKRIMPGVSKST